MGLDRYDTEQLVKWHHFAFRADLGRITELRDALEPWITFRDRAPLEQFWTRHMAEWRRAYDNATIEVDPRELSPLIEGAASVGIDPATVQARIDSLGRRISRVLRERILAFPKHAARVKRLRELDASALTIEVELSLAHRALELAPTPPWGDDEVVELEDSSTLDFSALFEACIELAIVDPWAANAGFGRLYERLSDELPKSVAMPLIDPSWPVHLENLEGTEPCVYGFDGFTIFFIEQTAAAEGHAALLAFEPAPKTLRAFAIDRVARDLEDAPTVAPERVRASVIEIETEWKSRKAALLGALADVAAGRSALLEWDAKNPAL